MKHQIDPKIDCVFKRILGSEDNRNLLLHFLNAMLGSELPLPITSVQIANPYNEKEFLNDKLSIVDVKATDNQDNIYQIEIQLLNYTHLPARILYVWSDIYSKQLQSGQDYHLLRPTYSIWLLAENLVKNDGNYLHRYKFRDDLGQPLIEHGGIWLLELEKFRAELVENEQARWLKFFREGESLNDEAGLPEWMNTQEMRQAMSTLQQFSEKESNYFAYQARQEYLRQQRTIQYERDTALEREQVALAERDAALAEIEHLKALLEQSQNSNPSTKWLKVPNL